MCDQDKSEEPQLGSDDVTIRPATADDMAAVADMIQELADFEKMPDGPKMSIEDLRRDFASSPPLFRCKVASCGLPGGGGPPTPLVGYALYFPTYSTWTGRSLMLEDLYVRPTHRKRGIGTKLFDAVAKEAHNEGCGRLDFHVLQWNPARRFYERRGAANLTQDEQWCYYRLQEPHLMQSPQQTSDTNLSHTQQQ